MRTLFFICLFVLTTPINVWSAIGDIITAKTVEGVDMKFVITGEVEIETDEYLYKGVVDVGVVSAYSRETPEETAIDKSYSGPITIPREVNGYIVNNIGRGAFKDIPGITSVFIPDDMKIGQHAFEGSGLKEVKLPQSIEIEIIIGSNAFDNCKNLTTISFPEGPVRGYVLDSRAFGGCESLTSVRLPEGTSSLHGGAFEDCLNIEEIYLPKSIKNLGRDSGHNRAVFGSTTQNYNRKLKRIYASMEDPVSTYVNEFTYNETDNPLAEVTLFVPIGTKETYASRKYWFHFINIVELEELTGVSQPKKDVEEIAEKAYYNISGVKVVKPLRGLNIVQMSDGRVIKIIK